MLFIGFDQNQADEEGSEEYEDEAVDDDYSPMTKQKIKKVEDGDVNYILYKKSQLIKLG